MYVAMRILKNGGAGNKKREKIKMRKMNIPDIF